VLKKRLIFTLLFDSSNGNFMLSRNFRLQAAGNYNWLLNNYDFVKLSRSLDELVLLDVSRDNNNQTLFLSVLQDLGSKCFIPVGAGGLIRNFDYALNLLRHGADKLFLNSPIFEDLPFIESLSLAVGAQSLVASIDVSRDGSKPHSIIYKCGSTQSKYLLSSPEIYGEISKYFGEIYITSINSDGTGQGLDLSIFDDLPDNLPLSVVIAGGAGKSSHLAEALQHPRVHGVSTANLFNFIGDSLASSRASLIDQGILLPNWAGI